jgi:HEAT repeat protein
MKSVDPLRAEDDPRMPILTFFLRLLTGRRARDEPSCSDIKRAAAAQILTIDGIVARPQTVDVTGDRFTRLAAANAAELERRLQDGFSARPAPEQVAVCRMLARIAPQAALAHLTDLAARSDLDDDLTSSVFREMWRTMFDVDKAEIPFDRQKVLDVLRKRLTSVKPRDRRQIANMLALLDLADAREALRGLLADPDIDVRTDAACNLANIKDAAGFAVLQQVLSSDAEESKRQRHRAILSLSDLVALDDPDLRAQVLNLAASQIERLLARADNEAANEVMNLLRPIEKGPPAPAVALLERVANSKMTPWIRDLAFQEQLTLGGTAALPAITKSLNDKTHLNAALHALMELGPAAASPGIVQGVARHLGECRPGRDADLAYRTLVTLGYGSHEAIASNRSKLTPWFAFAASARSHGLDAGGLLDLLRRTELIDDERTAAIGEERCRTFLTPQSNELDLMGGVLELLHEAKAMHVFDTENDRVPPDYVSLIEALASLAAPRFLISSVSLQPSATYQGHRILFLFDGKPSSLAVRDMGDWFDVSGVVGHLNELIEDRGRPERFVALYSGDQMSYLVFGHGERMIQAKREVGFPLADDPDAPMKVGQAYEQQVISEIERGS